MVREGQRLGGLEKVSGNLKWVQVSWKSAAFFVENGGGPRLQRRRRHRRFTGNLLNEFGYLMPYQKLVCSAPESGVMPILTSPDPAGVRAVPGATHKRQTVTAAVSDGEVASAERSGFLLVHRQAAIMAVEHADLHPLIFR